MPVYGDEAVAREIAHYLSDANRGPDGSYSAFDLRHHLLGSDFAAEVVAEQIALWRIHYFADEPGVADTTRFILSLDGKATVEELSRLSAGQ